MGTGIWGDSHLVFGLDTAGVVVYLGGYAEISENSCAGVGASC